MSVTVFFILSIGPYRVAACSKCLEIYLVYSSMCATMASTAGTDSSRMQSSRVLASGLTS